MILLYSLALLPREEEKTIDRATNLISHFIPCIVLSIMGGRRFSEDPHIDEKTLFPALKVVTVKEKQMNILENFLLK